MRLYGLDPEELADLANRFQGAAIVIDAERTKIVRLLDEADWRGSDKDRFLTEWQHHSLQLADAAEALNACGQQLEREIEAQVVASTTRASPAPRSLDGVRSVGAYSSTAGDDGRVQRFSTEHLEPAEDRSEALNRDLSGASGAPPEGGRPIASPPLADASDQELAMGIVDGNLGVLDGWKAAVNNFETVLDHSSNSDGSTRFIGAVREHFTEYAFKNLAALGGPVGSELRSLLQNLESERDRAVVAGQSASVRDFVVGHRSSVARLGQALERSRTQFVSEARVSSERLLEAEDYDAWGMKRLHLLESCKNVQANLDRSTPEKVFHLLSEEWIRSTNGGERGAESYVSVTLNPDHTVREAHIRAPGGQKIADQLVADSPEGFDVLSLRVPRRIIRLAENGFPAEILRLDSDGAEEPTRTVAPHNEDLVHHLKNNGLASVKSMNGD